MCSAPQPGSTQSRVGDATFPQTTTFTLLEPPIHSNPTAFNLKPGNGSSLLTWLEEAPAPPTADPATVDPERPDSQADPAWRLRLARLEKDSWTPSSTIVEEGSADFFANWADVPSAIEVSGGLFGRAYGVASWLEKLGEGTYAYGAQLALAGGDGRWNRAGLLHDDTSPTEHGFVSLLADGSQAHAVWLDGRAMEDGGPMSLRTTVVDRDGPQHPTTLLDERVCECCPTDAALTSDGPIVVYRNRSEDEVRDIWRVRWEGDRWSTPAPVHLDGWRINGCPVNGPAVAADGNLVAVAWYTGAGGMRSVLASTSLDGGRSFSPPALLDDHKPYGRVDVALADGLAWVSWLGESIDGPAVLLRPIQFAPGPKQSSADASARNVDSAAPQTSEPASSPALGPTRTVGLSSAARATGVPKLLSRGDSLLITWLEQDERQRRHLRVARVTW
jgi:hypothetical protein